MNLTYVLGAGASANALPIVKNMDERIAIFIEHFKKIIHLDTDEENHLKSIYTEISKHYTIDTYAKKLFLKGKHAEKDLFNLYNFMGAYFIYEQLKKEPNESTCSYLFENSWNIPDRNTNFQTYRNIIESVDYRYDSFYAALLKNDKNGDVYLPPNINIISWNYDFQLEISFMNFMISSGLDEIQNKLNIYPNPIDDELREESSIIKINGTAGFYADGRKYGDLFDFRNHKLDRKSMTALRSILFQTRKKYENSIYFAWNEDDITRKARVYAKKIISNTDILVVIGYSFPYFNREVDRDIFSALEERGRTIYIQTTNDTMESIKNRAIGANSVFSQARPFSEVDQFLIPNDLV